MKQEYDFTDAKRGKFYAKDAVLVPKLHLDSDVLGYLSARAQARGVALDELVNGLLRADIAAIEAAG